MLLWTPTPRSTEFNHLLARSIIVSFHRNIVPSPNLASPRGGLSNRICFIVYDSLIHISATPQSAKINTNEPLRESNELPSSRSTVSSLDEGGQRVEAESAPNLSNNRGNGVRQRVNSSGVLSRFIWAPSRGFRPGN